MVAQLLPLVDGRLGRSLVSVVGPPAIVELVSACASDGSAPLKGPWHNIGRKTILKERGQPGRKRRVGLGR